MNALQELKQILKTTNRKTLPIEQIEPLIEAIDKMYIQTGKKLVESGKKLSQEKEINEALRSVNGQLAFRLGMKYMPDDEIKKMFQQNKERKVGKYAKQPKQNR